jgi:hypothetical protein
MGGRRILALDYFAFGYNQGRAMEAILEKAVENADLSLAAYGAAAAAKEFDDFGG